MKTQWLVLAAAVLANAAQAAGPEVELVRAGKPHALPAAAQARIAELLPKLFSTCSVNSRDHPKGFASSDFRAMWRETAATDHLSVRFATPIEVGHPHRPGISARQLFLGLPDANYPSPHLSRDGDSVLAHGKCSGGDTIRFVCTPELKPLMPVSYHPLCAVLK